MIIRSLEPADFNEWLRMRNELWPGHDLEEFRAEMVQIVADPRQPVFVVVRPGGELGGFLEASIHFRKIIHE